MLFADVVHSMDIAAAVGPERLREIMAELVVRSAAVVRRYGGAVNSFTGDGIMAVFGAPLTLEHHAVHACLAALGIQDEANRLAVEARRRDGVELMLRVGLNSGEVIAGEVRPGPLGYTAIGQQVGMAQRMESVAPPGGVVLSSSTARLVERNAVLAEPELVWIKGADQPVQAVRLTAMRRHPIIRRAEAALVGRRSELSMVESALNRAIGGVGAVVGVVGPAGIGKSRLVRELSAFARRQGAEVFAVTCESHTSQIPFHIVAGLLRAGAGVTGLDPQDARAHLREGFPDADAEDLLLFADLLGVCDPGVHLPQIDPDARRRRLAALVNAAQMARITPALYIIEDVHWIDQVSESMLAEFISVIARTPSLAIITYRPEYAGALARVDGAQTLNLAPLSDAESGNLVSQLLGSDPTVTAVSRMIIERAAGTPFFAEEMVRDMAERGVLRGEIGAYSSTTKVVEVTVPASLQAIIGARIDRLEPDAKRTLTAASVAGSRFSVDLLTMLEVDPKFDDLVAAELIDQVPSTRQSEYVFHHPLIRAVAYESQLRADRAEMHRRVAVVLEQRESASVDENAALIAEHHQAAGDLHAAYGWHMRAATWARGRDITAARLSWERARTIADALPDADPNCAAMRIACRAMLCATAYRLRSHGADARFAELRKLCTRAEDKPSLAIAMAGLVMDHAYQGKIRQASQLASEAMALIQSVDDENLTVGLSYPAIYAKIQSGEYHEVLRWSQRVVDLAGDDPFKGNFVFGSPLALALTARATARYYLGLPDWRGDLRRGIAMAHTADPLTYAAVVALSYFPGVVNRVLSPDDRALSESEEALRIAERSGNDMALAFARFALGIVLVHRGPDYERDRGQVLLAEVSEAMQSQQHNLGELPLVNVYLARERVRHGEHEEAVPQMCAALDQLAHEGQLFAWGTPTTAVVAETLLDRAAAGDLLAAQGVIDRLAAAQAGGPVAMRDIWLLRLHALMARARGDAAAYNDCRERYRTMATTLDFTGHIELAAAMP
ncbi:membrane-anchored adenylyl cyclase [Mycolicibacterium farcinogenes]|uniref:Adenylate/guanylate cyclase family protein n=1 Tax=Mycolicibacterium senegalense TaxID=1796 RepID=A0A378W520_9MYCO|nr:class 3 adenylate cyclase/tetratricopeptide (TPR) repeat protein [Mycolicibacterium senegalense]CDP84606.1 membrane-anchored adenylyl cyclase [Mycolicibacterium farcinogenes]SUA27321.1 adenylate/guanylate cyclase family protein [Mycolicibacterium senegalense]